MEEKFLIPFYRFSNTFDITNLHIGSVNGTHVFVVVDDRDWFLNLFISFPMDFSSAHHSCFMHQQQQSTSFPNGLTFGFGYQQQQQQQHPMTFQQSGYGPNNMPMHWQQNNWSGGLVNG
jgi:hypothetical protein